MRQYGAHTLLLRTVSLSGITPHISPGVTDSLTLNVAHTTLLLSRCMLDVPVSLSPQTPYTNVLLQRVIYSVRQVYELALMRRSLFAQDGDITACWPVCRVLICGPRVL